MESGTKEHEGERIAGQFEGWDAWESSEWWPAPDETVAEWAESNLVLPRSVSHIPGPVSWDRTPYVHQILEDTQDPEVDEITLKFPTQVIKTMVLWTVALHRLHRDPSMVLHVMPTKHQAERLNVERYQRVIENSPSLAALFTGEKKEQTQSAITCANGGTIYFTGSNSAAELASRGCPLMLLDELDKMPGEEEGGVQGEGTAADLLRERTINFHGRKIFKVSTPKFLDGPIESEFAESNACRWWVPCPRCAGWQTLILGSNEKGTAGLKWPAKATRAEIISGRLAWYQCRLCGGRIEEDERMAMVRAGMWAPRGCRVREGHIRGKQPPRMLTGYHLWAIHSHSPKRTLHHIAAEYIRTRSTPKKRQHFRNSWLARGWARIVHELKKDHVRKCLPKQGEETHVMGECPQDAWAITCGVDVQAPEGVTSLYYVLRAWGAEERSWLVRCGFVEGWEPLEAILYHSAYRRPDGSEVPILPAFVDSGFRAGEVYQWCASVGCYAIKGDYKVSKDTILRGKGKSGQLRYNLFRLNSDHFKSMVHRMIHGQRWHLPPDTPDAYFDHMVAEQLTEIVDKVTGRKRYVYRLPPNEPPNHLFDCECYATASAEFHQLRFRKRKPRLRTHRPPSRRPRNPGPAKRYQPRKFFT